MPKNRKTAQEYAEGILQGDRSLLARSITIIESTLDSDRKIAEEILRLILPHTGNSIRIGISGVPGVGKSTFIDQFGLEIINRGNKLAVLAIDPSSAISGGSILGDKTRMEHLSQKKDVFIRPSPSAGTLGGVASKTRESIYLCEAAGFDTIIVETVGVGQSETAVHNMTDFFLLLMLSGAGDELQGIKRGIMEICDGMLITKADGDNKIKAKAAMAEYRAALHLFPSSASNWIPKVLTCSAIEKTGIAEAFEMILSYKNHTSINGYFFERRKNQEIEWVNEIINEELKNSFYSHHQIKMMFPHIKKQLEKKFISPSEAARLLLQAFHELK